LDVEYQVPRLIPNNVYAEIKATTVFGNKYVAFESPKAHRPSISRLPM
jgi:phospholipid/cholesterol/gamma-HCH transport system substrate-binding protein